MMDLFVKVHKACNTSQDLLGTHYAILCLIHVSAALLLYKNFCYPLKVRVKGVESKMEFPVTLQKYVMVPF